ncbi:MAG: ssl1498 family light-harvesting-like protein [Cyanobacteriota bacterium]|nr:ssl1498 family light-harvesting-like protein [Cyanobacteriota bacterium]
MHARQLDNGILNNYATEPPIYPAEYPSPEQQERYKLQGAIAALFVTALIFVSITVSAIA